MTDNYPSQATVDDFIRYRDSFRESLCGIKIVRRPIMTDNFPTADDIIVSIKVRLGELDLDIHDAKKKLRINYQNEVPAMLDILHILEKERETLQKIMRGEYGRG